MCNGKDDVIALQPIRYIPRNDNMDVLIGLIENISFETNSDDVRNFLFYNLTSTNIVTFVVSFE